MTNKRKGWLIFIAAMGMMFTLISSDIAALNSWNDVTAPGFVASTLAHLGAVIAAFIGGKLIPAEE